jgi:hypothetical protein
MMQGVLQHTLAALGYFLISILPHPTPISSFKPNYYPVKGYVHIVSNNETLIDISRNLYGSTDYWTTIWNDNPQIIIPSNIPSGMRLSMRMETPLLVEDVKSERIARLYSYPEQKSQTQTLAMSPVQNQVAIVSENQEAQPTSPSSYDEVYKAAGVKFDVPWQILYGIHLTETGLQNGAIYNAQGSGAQGPMQFMPGTWSAYGVDGDGDGKADINDASDAIYGAANFLAKHGGIQQGLYDYGGNTNGTLIAACARGYCM